MWQNMRYTGDGVRSVAAPAVAASARINFIGGGSFSRRKTSVTPLVAADGRSQKIAKFIYPTCIQRPLSEFRKDV